MLTNYHGLQHNKDLRTAWLLMATIGKKFAFTRLVVAHGFSLMFCCGLYTVKQFRGARSKWTHSIKINRPFSGAASGENLLLRWTSYQTSHSKKHSFYETLVGKLLQRG